MKVELTNNQIAIIHNLVLGRWFNYDYKRNNSCDQDATVYIESPEDAQRRIELEEILQILEMSYDSR